MVCRLVTYSVVHVPNALQQILLLIISLAIHRAANEDLHIQRIEYKAASESVVPEYESMISAKLSHLTYMYEQ